MAIAGGRDVGAANAFLRAIDGRILTFAAEGEGFVDLETGSPWDILGAALDSGLAGERLTPVVAINHFWFSWVAFKPETRVYQP